MNKLTGIDFKVVGVTFDDEATGLNRQIFLASMKTTDHVELVREPQNPHDTNAVAVVCNGNKIGYVGRQYVQILAPMMDQGREFQASIMEVDKYKNTYYCKIMVNEV